MQNKTRNKIESWSKIIKFRILAVRQMIVLGGGGDDGGFGGVQTDLHNRHNTNF